MTLDNTGEAVPQAQPRFTIITLNDDRKAYKDVLRTHVPFEEIELPAVDGRAVDLSLEFDKRGLRRSELWPNAKQGEYGVWLSNFDRWQLAAEKGPLIVFEDDAVVDESFEWKFNDFYGELPEDWDFAALWVPENQRQDFLYNIIYNIPSQQPQFLGYTTVDKSIYRLPGKQYAALAYQGYGMVALMYSQKGGKLLVDRARITGLTGPVDCWIYEQAKMYFVKGFAPRPEHADIVHYDWAAESHVQLTERAE